MHGRLALLLLVPHLAGCASEVDLVASGSAAPVRDAGGYFTDVHEAPACLSGPYVGAFYTLSGPFNFTGDISFALVTRPGEDTLTIDRDAKLEGEDETTRAQITAVVVGEGRCREGDFNARLEQGSFLPEGSISFPFAGTVTGTYFAEEVPAFYGDWTATAYEQEVGRGRWYAFYAAAPSSAP